jgi:multisubunit Na+/H+ antiporter MnhB subunit
VGLLRGSLPIKITAIYLAFTTERLKIMEKFLKPFNLLITANSSAFGTLFTYLYTYPTKEKFISYYYRLMR